MAEPVVASDVAELGERAGTRIQAADHAAREQAGLACRPAQADVAAVIGDGLEPLAARPAQLELGELHPRAVGQGDRLRDARVDLHQQRAPCGVPAELDLGDAVEPETLVDVDPVDRHRHEGAEAELRTREVVRLAEVRRVHQQRPVGPLVLAVLPEAAVEARRQDDGDVRRAEV